MYHMHDSVYGVISISQLAHKVTQHRIFQRLNHICQLGSLRFIHKHAIHTRYVHSIGTAYLARKFATVLANRYKQITPNEILCVEIAGLCHDIGHGPFSHLFDKLVDGKSENAHHEARSIILTKYILNDLRSCCNEASSLSDSDIELILYFIDTEKYALYNDISALKFTAGLEQIVNNAITMLDVDKLDYIERDRQSLHLSHLHSPIDIDKLFANCHIINNKLVFDFLSKQTVDNIVYRRHMLYAEFYYTADAKAADRMLSDALQSYSKEFYFNDCIQLQTVDQIDAFVQLTDNYIIEHVLNGKIPHAKQLILRIISGDLYKLVATFVSDEPLDGTAQYTSTDLTANKSSPSRLLPNMLYHYNGEMMRDIPMFKIVDRYDIRPTK